MDKDRLAGGARKVTGTVKEQAGKALGAAKTAAEGKREKEEGRAQTVIGHVKDTFREITSKK